MTIVVTTGAGVAPTGAAGGGLGGTYPNPTVASPELLADGTSVAPSRSFTLDPTSGQYRIGAGSVGFAMSGLKRLAFIAHQNMENVGGDGSAGGALELYSQITTAGNDLVLLAGPTASDIHISRRPSGTGALFIDMPLKIGYATGGQITQADNTVVMTLPSSGGVIDVPGTMNISSSVFRLNNASTIQWKDVGGTARAVVSVAADNTARVGFAAAPNTNGHLILYAAGIEAARFLPTSLAFNLTGKLYPGTDAGAQQSTAGIFAGTGVPANGNGANGDFYFRSDGGAGTSLYQRRTGAWVATAA